MGPSSGWVSRCGAPRSGYRRSGSGCESCDATLYPMRGAGGLHSPGVLVSGIFRYSVSEKAWGPQEEVHTVSVLGSTVGSLLRSHPSD